MSKKDEVPVHKLVISVQKQHKAETIVSKRLTVYYTIKPLERNQFDGKHQRRILCLNCIIIISTLVLFPTFDFIN